MTEFRKLMSQYQLRFIDSTDSPALKSWDKNGKIR